MPAGTCCRAPPRRPTASWRISRPSRRRPTSSRWAASGAARKPAATSTSSRAAPTPSLADAFVQHPAVERVLGHGGGKASVLMRGGFQADLRIVKPDQRGAAMQYFTGSKAHNIVLRDQALERGWKLNEYGLFDARGSADRRRHRRGHLQGARPGLRAAGAAREPRRDRGGAGGPRCPA